MCKILILTGHNPAQRNALIRAAWSYFHSSGERHGFGALWISETNRLAYIKSSAPRLCPSTPEWAEGFAEDHLFHKRSNGGALLIHGRYATCDVNVDNTHPFIDRNHGLIHNGVVSSDTYEPKHSTCDSEILLQAYLAAGKEGLTKVEGYAAFGLIDAKRNVHIARDNKANLHCARIPGHGWAFGTTPDAVRIATTYPSHEVKPWSLISFSPTAPRSGKLSQWKLQPPAPVKPKLALPTDYVNYNDYSNWPSQHTNGRSFQQSLLDTK